MDIELQIVKKIAEKEGIAFTHWRYWSNRVSPSLIEGEVLFLKMRMFQPDEIVAKYKFTARIEEKEGEKFVAFAKCTKCGLIVDGDTYSDILMADGGPFCPRCGRPTLKPVYRREKVPVLVSLGYQKII